MSDGASIRDSFTTLAAPAYGIYKVKGSKHHGYVFPIAQEDEVGDHLRDIRKKHHDARHHALAYRIGLAGDVWRTSDDGEPNNSAGPPILGAFKSREITNCLGIVVRYFGGTKLGVGGLIDAYRTATLCALENAQLVERILFSEFALSFSYELIGVVMNHLDKWGATPQEQIFLESCSINVKIRMSHAAAFESATREIYGVNLEES
tara:strand:+ start:4508 stop:5125 length:618 start_codon:yes stop_codon:yes gene_type:complete